MLHVPWKGLGFLALDGVKVEVGGGNGGCRF
jgi:hypothetical protein